MAQVSEDQLRQIGGCVETIQRAAEEINHSDNPELDGAIDRIRVANRTISQIVRDVQAEPEPARQIGKRTPVKAIE